MQKRIVLISIFLLLVIGVSGFVWYETQHPLPEKSILLQVEPADTISTITQKLITARIIKYKYPLYIAYYIYKKNPEIATGAYTLSTTMSLKAMVYKLDAFGT
jgi:cell division protein YceG involved in septum cleavage